MKDWARGITSIEDKAGKYGVDVLSALEDEFPQLADHIVVNLYGGLFQENGLSNKDQALVTISSLVTQGAFDQLDFHYRVALNAGLTVDEIKGVLLHLVAYVGVPKVVSAFAKLKAVLSDIT